MVVDQGWLATMTKVLHQTLLERLRSNSELLDRPVDSERLELYHRASRAIRVSREKDGRAAVSRTGFEEGVAVRLQIRGAGGAAFAAASGGGLASLRWAIDRAMEHGGGPRANAEEWRQGAGLLLDHDSDGELPREDDLISWLSEASEGLEEWTSGWVEAVTTVESWVADGGAFGSRCRTRGWAVARGRSRPLVTASRRWEELRRSAWADLAAERERSSSTVGGQQPVLFTAEAAAELVSAVVRGCLITNEIFDAVVGSGWVVADDPASPQALFGGSFDDATFPTERRVLADGRKVVACIGGPGCLSRPSFRDPPQPMPSHLVVEGPAQASFDGGLIVTGLTIHPLAAGEWVIELDGSSGGSVEGFIRTNPLELMKCCTGAVGSSKLSHRGVVTPALLFEGLNPML